MLKKTNLFFFFLFHSFPFTPHSLRFDRGGRRSFVFSRAVAHAAALLLPLRPGQSPLCAVSGAVNTLCVEGPLAEWRMRRVCALCGECGVLSGVCRCCTRDPFQRGTARAPLGSPACVSGDGLLPPRMWSRLSPLCAQCRVCLARCIAHAVASSGYWRGWLLGMTSLPQESLAQAVMLSAGPLSLLPYRC